MMKETGPYIYLIPVPTLLIYSSLLSIGQFLASPQSPYIEFPTEVIIIKKDWKSFRANKSNCFFYKFIYKEINTV
jgi:hypothetical protein